MRPTMKGLTILFLRRKTASVDTSRLMILTCCFPKPFDQSEPVLTLVLLSYCLNVLLFLWWQEEDLHVKGRRLCLTNCLTKAAKEIPQCWYTANNALLETAKFPYICIYIGAAKPNNV